MKQKTENDDFAMERLLMVKLQIEARGLRDDNVLDAMRRIERHRFVPEHLLRYAYEDCALETSHGQTISQPYIVALMTSLAKCAKDKNALEIGTGSGYQTAILAELCSSVVSLEIIDELYLSARERLGDIGYGNVELIRGDGYGGWPDSAPYDVIIVTACPPYIPQSLIDQLAPGGRLVIPVGTYSQVLKLVVKDDAGNVSEDSILGVRFVPMVRRDIGSG